MMYIVKPVIIMAFANELTLVKEQTRYNDLLDGLRLGLKAYKIE